MTGIIKRSQLSRPLTCEEYDSNLDAVLQRANHLGTQLASTISDFPQAVAALPIIIDLQECCVDLLAQINSLRNDIFSQGALQNLLASLRQELMAIINLLTVQVNRISDLQTIQQQDIDSLTANINALNSSVATLQSQINLKAPIDNAALTGTPTAVDAIPPNDSSKRLATTAFVQSKLLNATPTIYGSVRTHTSSATPIVYRKEDVDLLLSSYAPIDSPVFTGWARIANAFQPPAPSNDNSISTTAWVRNFFATSSTTVATASSTVRGILKTNSDTTDPVVYLKQEVDSFLSSKAPIDSPTFTGACIVPNASLTGTSTIGNTTIQGTADLQNPPPLNDNSTRIPNTSWVVAYVTGATAPPTPGSAEQAETPILMSRFTGAYSLQRRASIDALIKTLKINGIYSLLDRLFIFMAPTVADAMQNWIVGFNNAASFSGPPDRHIADVGLTEGSATVSGLNTLTNCKPYNMTMTVDNWTKASNTSTISGGSAANGTANPFFELQTSTILDTNSNPDTLSEQGTFALTSAILAQGAPTLSAGFSNNSSSAVSTLRSTIYPSVPLVVSASVTGRGLTLYRNGAVKSYGACTGALPDWPATNAVIATGFGGFCSHAVIGAYLTPAKHQILSEAIHTYISNYISVNYSSYLT